MKTKLLILTALLMATVSQAQNNLTAVPNLITNADGSVWARVPAGTVAGASPTSPLGELGQAVKDGVNNLSSQSFKNGFTASALGLYHSGSIGFIAAVNTDATNSMNYGFFVGGLQTKNTAGKNTGFGLYDGGFNISANGTYNEPFIGEVNLQLETGAVVDLSNVKAGAFSQTTTTGYKEIYGSKDGNFSFGGTGGLGYSTLFSDGKPFYLAGLTVTDHLQGKGFLGLWGRYAKPSKLFLSLAMN
jgi:hypothetical protein